MVLRWLLGTMLALLLCLALVIFIVARYPADVVNQAAAWFELDLSVGKIDYHIEADRLVLFIQQAAFHTDMPETDVQLAQLGLDLGFSFFGDRYVALNELGLAGLEARVVQEGNVAWWQQYMPQDEHPPQAQQLVKPAEPATTGAPWRFEIGAINVSDFDVRISLVEVQRDYHLHVDHFGSGLARNRKRWVQSRGSFNDEPLHIDGEMLGLRYILEERQAFNLDLDVNIANITLQAAGSFDPFENRGNTSLALNVDATSIPDLVGVFGLSIPPFDDARVKAVLTDSTEGYFLDNIDIRFMSSMSSVSITGSVFQPLQQWLPQLDLEVKIDSLASALKNLADVDMGSDLKLLVRGHLQRESQFLAITDTFAAVSLQGFDFNDGYQFEVSEATVRLPKDEIHGWAGDFSLPLEVRGGKALARLGEAGSPLYFDLGVDTVDMIITEFGMGLSAAARYKGVAAAVDFSMEQDWEQLATELHFGKLKANLKSDLTQAYIPLDFTVRAGDLRAANRILGWDLKPTVSLGASGSVRINPNDTITLHQLKATVVDQATSLSATIPWLDIARTERLKMALQVKVSSLEQAAPLIDQAITYTNEGRWAQVMEALSSRPPAATRAAIDDVLVAYQLGPLMGEYPWLRGRLNMAAQLELQPESGVLLHDIDIDFNGPQARLRATGQLSKQGDSPRVALDLSAWTGADVVFGFPLPVSLKGGVKTQGSDVMGEDITLLSGDSDMQLTFSLSDPFGDKPTLVAALASSYLDVSPFVEWEQAAPPQQDPAGAQGPSQSEPAAKGKSPSRLFSDQPFDMGLLDRFEGLVTVRFDHIDMQRMDIREFGLEINLRDGALKVPRLRLSSLGGLAYGNGSIVPRGDGFAWQMDGVVEGLDVSQFQSTDPEQSNNGRIDMLVNLSSEGQSAHALMSTLSGRFTLAADDLVVYGFNLDRLAPNFIKSTLQLINPLKWGAAAVAETRLECALAHAVFGDGLMEVDRTILARTPESTFLGSWFVDFRSEEQKVQVIPKVRKGIVLSTTSLAKTVAVTGSLTQPKVEVDPAGLFLVGAGSAALYATGGFLYYLAYQQIERSLTRPSACEDAMAVHMGQSLEQLKLPVRQDTLEQ